jgi:YD repeat-containing protein
MRQAIAAPSELGYHGSQPTASADDLYLTGFASWHCSRSVSTARSSWQARVAIVLSVHIALAASAHASERLPKSGADVTIVLDLVTIVGSKPPPVDRTPYAFPDSRYIPSGPREPTYGYPSERQQEAPAPYQNTDPDCTQNPASQAPVIIATGEKYLSQKDFAAGGDYGLSLTRVYRSKGVGSSSPFFGPYWASNLDYPNFVTSGVVIDKPTGGALPVSITITFPGGGKYVYVKSGRFTYTVGSSASMGTITFTPDEGLTLNYNKKLYTYAIYGGIQLIESVGHAPLMSLQYGSNLTQPVRIYSGGRFINLTWTNNRVTSITDQGGNTWNYAYNSNGMLITVTSPGPSADVRTYYYEDSVNVTRLTGLTINGIRYGTYQYDSSGRVTRSTLAGGEVDDKFVYATNNTTLTEAAGQATTYTFGAVQGGLKLTSTSRVATATCAAAVAQTVYDANGWTDYTLDWKGNKTDYTYDVAGKLLDVTSAAGTTNALTSTNTWSGSDLVETTSRSSSGAAYAKVTYTYVASGLATGKLASETSTDLRLGGSRQT